MKVSNQPFEDVEPYLIGGLDVFVGAESLVLRGLEHGAAGAVSGLAAVFPELVARLVHERTGEVGEVRAQLERFPFQAAASFSPWQARGSRARGRQAAVASAVAQ